MNEHYVIGDSFILEPDRYRLLSHDKETPLSQKETELLVLLCVSSLSVVERNYLLDSIWKNSESGDIGLNKNILMLRRKFESLGIKNAIQTVPRIGYMLLLEAKIVTMDNPIERASIKRVKEEESKSTHVEPPYSGDSVDVTGNHVAWRWFVPKIALISLLLVITCIYFILPLRDDNKNRLIDSVDRYESPLGVLFIQKDIEGEMSDSMTHVINEINRVFSRVADHAKYYILASQDNISVVSISRDGTRKQSNFLVDNGVSNFREELLCAVNNMISNERQVQTNTRVSSSNVKFVSMRFFGSCHDKTFLLDLNIKRNGHPNKIKTLLQNFTAKNDQGITLFHFDRTSERKEIRYPDGGQEAIFHNAPASFVIDADDAVGNSDDILKIIGEFTAGKVRQTMIDSTYGVFMSDVMGGVLYFAV